MKLSFDAKAQEWHCKKIGAVAPILKLTGLGEVK